jgi:hypothetical protein
MIIEAFLNRGGGWGWRSDASLLSGADVNHGPLLHEYAPPPLFIINCVTAAPAYLSCILNTEQPIELKFRRRL